MGHLGKPAHDRLSKGTRPTGTLGETGRREIRWQDRGSPAFRVRPQSQKERLRLVALVVSTDLALLLFTRRSAGTSGVRVIPACPPRFPFRHSFNVPAGSDPGGRARDSN